MIKKLFFLFLMLVSQSAFADQEPTGEFRLSWNCGIQGDQIFPSPSAIGQHCAAHLQTWARANGYPGCTVTVAGINYGSRIVTTTGSNCSVHGESNPQYAIVTQSCPAGHDLVNNYCVSTGPNCVTGTIVQATFSSGTGPAGASSATQDQPFPQSYQGCAVSVDEIVQCYSETVGLNEQFYCSVKLKQTGAVSSSGEGTPATSDPSKPDKPAVSPPVSGSPGAGCPRGTVRIGTDSAGTAICAGQGTSPAHSNPPPTTTKPPVTTNNPDGSTTKTEVIERTNSDGSKTTTTKTTVTAADGTQTLSENTTTGNAPSGGTGKADPTKEDQNDFCKKNPTLTVCRNSTISGACAATSCEGDAITCEIARKAREAQCKQQSDEDALKAAPYYQTGKQALEGNDPMAAQLPTPDKATVINLPTSLDKNGWLGAGACPSDKTFHVSNGFTVMVPFSEVCPYLIPLRAVVMLFASLVSLSIIFSMVRR